MPPADGCAAWVNNAVGIFRPFRKVMPPGSIMRCVFNDAVIFVRLPSWVPLSACLNSTSALRCGGIIGRLCTNPTTLTA